MGAGTGLSLRVGAAVSIFIGAVKVMVTLLSGPMVGVAVPLGTALPSIRKPAMPVSGWVLKLPFQLLSSVVWSEVRTFFRDRVYFFPGCQPLVGVSIAFLAWMLTVKSVAGLTVAFTDLGSTFRLKLTTTGSFRRMYPVRVLAIEGERP